MTRNEKQSPIFIFYRDYALDYSGIGVLIKDDHQFVSITYPIGALLIQHHPTLTVEDLPRYPMISTQCEWSLADDFVSRVPNWIYEFPIHTYTAEEIHHIGLFFEWFIKSAGPLNIRLEKSIESSLLKKGVMKVVIRFIIEQEKGNIGLLKTVLSPVIQRIIYHKD